MAAVDGDVTPRLSSLDGSLGGKLGDLVLLSAGLPTTTTHYRMRAWNLNTVDWEFWNSVDLPDTTPPSGDPVTGTNVIRTWST